MTGPSTEYTDSDIRHLRRKLGDAWRTFGGSLQEGQIPDRLTITGRIEWAGNTEKRDRTVHLDGLSPEHMERVREALEAADKASGRPERLSSYRATGWRAKFNALQRTGAGRDAAARAGLTPTRETQAAWRSGTRSPSKANRERIDAAYESAATRFGRNSGEKDKAVVDELNSALRERYQAEIRFTNVQDMDLE